MALALWNARRQLTRNSKSPIRIPGEATPAAQRPLDIAVWRRLLTIPLNASHAIFDILKNRGPHRL